MVLEVEQQNGAPGGLEVNSKPRRGKPPFQLCFGAAQEQGRSELSRPKLPRNTYIITPKFYSKVDALKEVDSQIVKELAQEIKTLRNEGPREKYHEPILESHSYGWHPLPLVPMVKNNRRYNHHRITSDMVKVQCILHNATQAEKEFEQHLLLKSTKKK